MNTESKEDINEKALEWAVLFFTRYSPAQCPLDWFEPSCDLSMCNFDGVNCSGLWVLCWKKYFQRMARDNMGSGINPAYARKGMVPPSPGR